MSEKRDFRSMLQTAEKTGREAIAPLPTAPKAPEEASAPAPVAAPEASRPAPAPSQESKPRNKPAKPSAAPQAPQEPVEYVQFRGAMPFDLYHDAKRYVHARKLRFQAFCEEAIREYMKNHP